MSSTGPMFLLVAGITAASSTPAAIIARTAVDPDSSSAAFLDFVRDVGIPAGIVMFGALGCWKAGRFLGPVIAEWLKAQAQQARVVIDAMPRMERAMDSIAERSKEIPERLDRIERETTGQTAQLERLLSEVQRASAARGE